MTEYVLSFESYTAPASQGKRPAEFKYAIRRVSDNQLVFRAESKELADQLMARLRRKKAA